MKSEAEIIKTITNELVKKGYEIAHMIFKRHQWDYGFSPDLVVKKDGKTVVVELKNNKSIGMIGTGSIEMLCSVAEIEQQNINSFVLATSAAANVFERNTLNSVKNIKVVESFDPKIITENIEAEFKEQKSA